MTQEYTNNPNPNTSKILKELILKGYDNKHIKFILKNDYGINKDSHCLDSMLFKLRKINTTQPQPTQPQPTQPTQPQPTQPTQPQPTQPQPTQPTQQTTLNLNSLIPKDNGFIDCTGLIEDFIIMHNYNKNCSDNTEKLNVFLYGETGTGKTQAGEQLAYRLNLPLWNYTFNGETNTEQLLGYKDITTDSNGNLKTVWIDGILTKAVRNGGVLLLNEINSCSHSVMFSLFSLLEKSRILVLTDNNNEHIKAHKDLFIIATANLNYEGVNSLNIALKSRLNSPKEIKYNIDVEKKLIKKGKILNKNLVDLAQKQRIAYFNNEYSNPISTRELIIFTIHYNLLGLEKATEFLLNHFTTEEEKKSLKDLIVLFFSKNPTDTNNTTNPQDINTQEENP